MGLKKGEKKPENWKKRDKKKTPVLFTIDKEIAEKKPTSKTVNTLLCEHYKSKTNNNDEK